MNIISELTPKGLKILCEVMDEKEMGLEIEDDFEGDFLVCDAGNGHGPFSRSKMKKMPKSTSRSSPISFSSITKKPESASSIS